jgi:DNA-directed RNA polymerase specialized sigma subunit
MKKVQTPEQTAYERAVQYLSKIEHIDNMINAKQEQIDSLRAKASSTGLHTQADRVQSSGCKDKIGECCTRIADLCEEINQDIDDFVNAKAEVMHTIDKLIDLEERRLLYYRYFQYLPFSKIAHEMNISERHIYRMHKSAVFHIVEILETCH